MSSLKSDEDRELPSSSADAPVTGAATMKGLISSQETLPTEEAEVPSLPAMSDVNSNTAGTSDPVDPIYGEEHRAEVQHSSLSSATPVAASTSTTEEPPAITSNEAQVFENDLGIDDGLEDDEDKDSALGSSVGGEESTYSIESSVYHFVEENGHTYHRYKDGKYVLPNDEAERDRLDLMHQLWLFTLRGKLHLAPLHKLTGLHNVLDIGTGTGIWAIDFANRYPSAEVTGTDLSPIQPEFVPPNCHFEIDDAEDEWLYHKKFDYIHGRAMHLAFSDYSAVIKSAFDNLHPGGYLELQDMRSPPGSIDSSYEGTSLEYWLHLLHQGSIKLGLNWRHRNWQYRKFFEDAGFVDVVETHFQWPINGWPKGRHNKILGQMYNQSMTGSLHGLSAALLSRGLGMSSEEIELLLVNVRKDLCNKDIHVFSPVLVIHGRKPI